jgi:hypothetical protein
VFPVTGIVDPVVAPPPAPGLVDVVALLPPPPAVDVDGLNVVDVVVAVGLVVDVVGSIVVVDVVG